MIQFKIKNLTCIYVLPFLFGIVTILGFSPFDIYLFTFFGVGLFIYSICHKTLRPNYIKKTLLYSMGFYISGVYWIFNSIYVFGNLGIFFSLLITLVLILVMSILQVGQVIIFSKLLIKDRPILNTFSFSSTWVLSEWTRGQLFSGFPWLYIGYTQVNSFLKPFATTIGVYGVSFIVIFICYSIINIFIYRKNIKILGLYFYVFTIILIGLFISSKNWTKVNKEEPIKVALIQGNIPQDIKWDRTHIKNIISKYINLTKKNLDSDLIVWPEASFPIPIPYANSKLNLLKTEANKHNLGFIIGIPELDISNNKSFNSILTIGSVSGHYRKKQLVLFGEYIPFYEMLEPLIHRFNINIGNNFSGEPNQPNLRFKNVEIATFICYEIAYEENLFDIRRNADILLTVINDAWFGKSTASYQHLQIARFRSIQAAKYQMVCSNDGITAIIDPKGNIQYQIPPYIDGFLTGTIFPTKGQTPAVRFGGLPMHIIIVMCIIIAVIKLITIKKHKNKSTKEDNN